MIRENFAKGVSRDMELYLCDRDEGIAPGTMYGPVIRDIFVFECCTGGYGSVEINGREFQLKKGDCTVLFPGSIVLHRADNTEPRRGVWCAVDGIRLGTCLENAGITPLQPYAPQAAFDGVCAVIEQMLADKYSVDNGVYLRRCGYVYSLLGEILRVSETSVKDYSQRAKQIMEATYDRLTSVSDIAAQVGLERAYFSTLFKAQTGKTPYEYLTELRIKKACALLVSTSCTIADIACAVGIAPENFSRLFKRFTGTTPGSYAAAHR